MSDIDTTLCDEAVKIVTGARRERYDKPERNFERIAKVWEGLTDRTYTAHEVALMFVGLKIVRDAYSPQRDNKVDGIGYLLCADAVTCDPESDDVDWDTLVQAARDDDERTSVDLDAMYVVAEPSHADRHIGCGCPLTMTANTEDERKPWNRTCPDDCARCTRPTRRGFGPS